MTAAKSFFWGVLVVSAVGVLLAYGWAEGQWTGRWHPSNATKLAAAKLKTVPMSIGDWEAADGPFNESQLAIGELDGYIHRIYSHRVSGEQVQVLIVCGRAGPVSLHTPDVCYRGLGYLPLSQPTRRSLMSGDSSGGDAWCWGADFQKTTPFGRDLLRIGWTWLSAGRWQAADQPRFEYATEPVLFKAYFIHNLHKEEVLWDDDSIPKLAKDLLPVLTEHLTRPDGAAPPEAPPAEGPSSPDGEPAPEDATSTTAEPAA